MPVLDLRHDKPATAGRPATGRPTATAGLYRRGLKRAFDLVFAAGALILALPLMLLIAVAIRLESPGPALFRQERLGRHGRRFSLLKFRGMYTDARERFPELYDYESLSQSSGEWHFHAGDAHDPRVTRVGRFIRRYSLDELPNFVNVLRGDMSVVGPRPEIPELADLYGDALDDLLSVRPGVTSPIKATSRDEASFAETLAAELEYVRSISLGLDVATIVRTATRAFAGVGVR